MSTFLQKLAQSIQIIRSKPLSTQYLLMFTFFVVFNSAGFLALAAAYRYVASVIGLNAWLYVGMLTIIVLEAMFLFRPVVQRFEQEQDRLKQEIAERKRAEEALCASQQFVQRITAMIPEVVYIHDFSVQSTVYTNRSLSYNLGYDPANEQKELPEITFEALLHPDDLTYLPERVRRTRSACDEEVVSTEYRMKHADGTWHWYLSRDVVFKRDADGTVQQLLGVTQDITERKRAEQQALELAFERERTRLLSQFVTAISHDFRTPLSVLNTSAYLLQRTTDPERIQQRIQVIEAQVGRLEKLLDQLMLMTRLDQSNSLELRPTSVKTLLESVQTALSGTAARKGIQLSLDLTDALQLVLANEYYLQHALKNLIENAIEHMPEGGTVTLRTWAGDGLVTLEVSDTGTGIAPDDLPHIFERFHRGDAARSVESGGAGLGLPMAKRIVELHNGRIEVDSAVGEGSSFRLLLPTSL